MPINPLICLFNDHQPQPLRFVCYETLNLFVMSPKCLCYQLLSEMCLSSTFSLTLRQSTAHQAASTLCCAPCSGSARRLKVWGEATLCKNGGWRESGGSYGSNMLHRALAYRLKQYR